MPVSTYQHIQVIALILIALNQMIMIIRKCNLNFIVLWAYIFNPLSKTNNTIISQVLIYLWLVCLQIIIIS